MMPSKRLAVMPSKRLAVMLSKRLAVMQSNQCSVVVRVCAEKVEQVDSPDSCSDLTMRVSLS
jgi:hypothetical protein